MFETSTNSTNVCGILGFNFDIIVAQLDLPNTNVEDNSKLWVVANFIDKHIKITSSRINVHEFKQRRSFEFLERLAVIKDRLIENPLECEVYYDSQLVGSCKFQWPDSFVNCISAESGKELIRCEEADIYKDNEKVGRISIIARLLMKGQELHEQMFHPKYQLCNPADNTTNPNDVMFVVGKTSYGSVGCSEIDVDVVPASKSATSRIATCLDLSDLHPIHGKILPTINVLDTIGPKCFDESVPNQCDEIIKNLIDKSKEPPYSVNTKSKQQAYQLPGVMQINAMDCKCDSCSSTDSCQPFRCISTENTIGYKNISQKDGIEEKPRKRYCALCRNNITWLPKYAACPKCSFRPILHNFEEKPYDDRLTANKILQEYENYNSEGDKISESSDTSVKKCKYVSECRCTCTNGKTCAHCRIRKLCEDIFQSSRRGDRSCGKCETKEDDLYNICKTNDRNCRPYLAKVFQQLKDIFDMNNEANTKSALANNDQKKVSGTFESISSSDFKSHQSQEESQKSHQSHSKNIYEDRKTHKSCKNKTQQKCPGVKNSHRSCIAGLKIVPRNMGWLWNTETKGLRTGWVPGAIRKPIKNLMQYFLHERLYASNGWNIQGDCDETQNGEKDYTKEPTLHICKRNGVYYITLRPCEGIGTLKECTEPYWNTSPIQFKITKNPLLIEFRNIKQKLKGMGFSKCFCHRPISFCYCRSFLEKKKLEYQCRKECCKREMNNCSDTLVLSDTTDSEGEFDFGVTPPAGVVQPSESYTKRKKVNSGTQYEMDDWNIEQTYPKPSEKYFKLYNCATGNRFGKAFGPYGMKGYTPGGVAIQGGLYGPRMPGRAGGRRVIGGGGGRGFAF